MFAYIHVNGGKIVASMESSKFLLLFGFFGLEFKDLFRTCSKIRKTAILMRKLGADESEEMNPCDGHPLCLHFAMEVQKF